MADNRPDYVKEQSPYFSHWRYTGNRIQQALARGPREAVYKTISEEDAIMMAAFSDTVELQEHASIPVAVTGQKAISAQPLHQWMLSFAEGTGFSVNKTLYQKSPWAFRCIDILAKAMAAIPWAIVKGDAEQDNALSELLQTVNPEINWHDHISATVADLQIYGMAYWLKIRQGGKVKFIQRLNPNRVRVKADSTGIQYFERVNSEKDPWRREDIVFFHRYDPENDFGGVSPLMAAKAAIKVEIEADNHLAEFFENRAMPDYVMSLQTTNANEIKRLSASWEKEFGGKGNRHKTGWVGGGAEVREIGYAPDKLALETVRAEARRQICSAFGVPTSLAGAWESANYATMKEQHVFLNEGTVIPDARYIEGVINAELAKEFPNMGEFRWLFNDMAIRQEDLNDRAKRMAWLVNARILKRETAAAELGYSAEDVPDEQAPPPNNNFESNISGSVSAPGDDLSDERKSTKTEGALRKWRRKAIRRVKDGKKAICSFNSQYISEHSHDKISESLKSAVTEEDVDQIFDDALTWGNYPALENEEDEDMDFMKAMLLAKAMQGPPQPAQPPVVQYLGEIVHHDRDEEREDRLIEVLQELKGQQKNSELNEAMKALIESVSNVTKQSDEKFESMIDVLAQAFEKLSQEQRIQIRSELELPPHVVKALGEKQAAAPKPISRKEKQKLIRKQGELVGSETEVTYEYED